MIAIFWVVFSGSFYLYIYQKETNQTVPGVFGATLWGYKEVLQDLPDHPRTRKIQGWWGVDGSKKLVLTNPPTPDTLW